MTDHPFIKFLEAKQLEAFQRRDASDKREVRARYEGAGNAYGDALRQFQEDMQDKPVPSPPSQKKYEITSIQHPEIPYLHRIVALRDIPEIDVKAGDVGGFVQYERNLSQDEDCWVSGNAIVRGEARVFGNAHVFGHAEVYGSALVFGNAKIRGEARVFGNAKVQGKADVSGFTWICDDASVYGAAQVYGNAVLYENAEVYGNARVSGNSRITGSVPVFAQ